MQVALVGLGEHHPEPRGVGGGCIEDAVIGLVSEVFSGRWVEHRVRLKAPDRSWRIARMRSLEAEFEQGLELLLKGLARQLSRE